MNPYATTHHFDMVNVHHSQEALECMMRLSLIKQQEHQASEILECLPEEAYKSLLEAKRHIPPCYAVDRPYSPANPFLFAMMKCAMNVQYTTSYLILRYLAKYVGSVDKSQRIIVKAPEKGERETTFRANMEDLYNTKITGNRIQQQLKEKKSRQDDRHQFEGRGLSTAELAMHFLQYPMIVTTLKFVYVPTGPMAERPMLKKSPYVNKLIEQQKVRPDARGPRDLDTLSIFANLKARQDLHFPLSRQYDDYQVITFKDAVFQSGAIDRVTAFGLRPLELRFMKSVPKYWIYFTREPMSLQSKDMDIQLQELKQLLTLSIWHCPWIDAFGYSLKVRKDAVPKVLQFIKNIPSTYTTTDFGSEPNRRITTQLFQRLSDILDGSLQQLRQNSSFNEELLERFVTEGNDSKSTTIPTYWFRTVKATESERFLYHLLISMGKFNCEFELVSQGTLVRAFIHARLFTSSTDTHDQEVSVHNLVRDYITKQLVYIPAGTRTFDRQVVAAFNIIEGLLLRNEIVIESLPSALFTRLRQDCSTASEKYCEDSRISLLQSLHGSLTKAGIQDLPSTDIVKAATFDNPAVFDILKVSKSQYQPEDSYDEHIQAYTKVQRMVSHYKQATKVKTKSVCFVGAGGVGKTTAMQLAGLYCLSQGLFVLSTTLMGKRGAAMAGEHLHLRFKLTTNDHLAPSHAAEQSICKLLRDGQRIEILRRVDVVLIDELGQVDARLLSVIDIILRRIRQTNEFFGGAVIITTMDVQQLKPIKGLPPLLCPVLISSFVYHEFMISVRASQDPILQRIQQISRLSKATLENDPALKEEFKRLLSENCNFVDSIDDLSIPESAVYCYGRRGPCKDAEKNVLHKMKLRFPDLTVTRKAIDWEQTKYQQHPVLASEGASNSLDRVCKPPRELSFFPNAVYELTFNDPECRFFQSQLCILLSEVPTQEQIDRWEDIEVYRAPHGCDEVPTKNLTETQLLQDGWVKLKIGKHPDRQYNLGNNGLCGRREQYGLKHRIAMTIHAVMGETVTYLVTKIGEDAHDVLWEAAQAIVLLSRTRYGKNLFFIGNPKEVIESLWRTLLKRNQFSDYIQHLLDTLCHPQDKHDPFTIDQTTTHPYRPKDVLLPGRNDHCSYFLVSLAPSSTATYVGETSNLKRRLNQHNSGNGSQSTNRPHLRPWALLGYVIGFESKQKRRNFEYQWKLHIENAQIVAQGSLSAMEKLHLATEVISMSDEDLHLVICGTI
jgi:predicted GIY-YIG superfamily endonuclease